MTQLLGRMFVALATITLYDVGSESHWHNLILLTSLSGSYLWDTDDHWRGTTGDFTNGPLPGKRVGSIVQTRGLARMEFWRIDSDTDVQIVVNGQSPMSWSPAIGIQVSRLPT